MSASWQNRLSAAWVSTHSCLGAGGGRAELESRGPGGRAAATQPQPTVAVWERRAPSCQLSSFFPKKLGIKISCLNSLHLKSCQLIQNFWKQCVGQQMCRPSQISLHAWFGSPSCFTLETLSEFKNAYHSEWFGDIYNYLCTFSEEKPWVRLLEHKSQTTAILII